MSGFRVLVPGAQSSVQDSGFSGCLYEGLCFSGAMDQRSLALANLLVGNEKGEAGIEITAIGPSLEFEEDEIVAVTGADISPMVDGASVENYRAILVRKGQALSFGMRKSGFRAYIAFAGGLDIKPYHGSRSTILRSEIGALDGRKLQRGDTIGFRAPRSTMPNLAARVLDPEPISDTEVTLRVVPGPQDYLFPKESLAVLENPEGYTVSEKFNRQGYRLHGPAIKPYKTVDIISDGIANGAIQVSPTGEPFVLLSESSPYGGYAKIGNVITVDLPKIAQTFVGSRIRFSFVDVDEAQRLYVEEQRYLQSVQEHFAGLKDRCYRVYVNGEIYDISVEEIP